jgi:hypothetical protein
LFPHSHAIGVSSKRIIPAYTGNVYIISTNTHYILPILLGAGTLGTTVGFLTATVGFLTATVGFVTREVTCFN